MRFYWKLCIGNGGTVFCLVFDGIEFSFFLFLFVGGGRMFLFWVVVRSRNVFGLRNE